MNHRIEHAIAVMLLLACAATSFAQSTVEREQRQLDLYREALRHVENQLSLSSTDPAATDVAALGEYALAQLGRPGDPTASDPRDRFDTGLYKATDRYSRLLADTLGDDAGRWIGTNDEAVLVFLSLNRDAVLYGDAQLDARAMRLGEMTSVLRDYDAATLGAFDIESNDAAERILEDATWTLDRQEEVERRIATINRFRQQVPEGADVDDLPTLATAIEQYIGTIAARERLVEESAREKERIAALERRRDQAASTERERIETELRRTRELSGISLSILERDFDLRVAEQQRELANREADIARELAEIEREKSELELELAKRNEQIQQLEEQLNVYEAKVAVRELDPEVRGLVRLLSAPGTWKPVINNEQQLLADAHYGVEPQPHSLSALTAAGVLDKSPHGAYRLYVVLANRFNDRPSYSGSWPVDYYMDKYVRLYGVDPEDLARTDTVLYSKMQEIQDALREYGDALVEEGLLRP